MSRTACPGLHGGVGIVLEAVFSVGSDLQKIRIRDVKLTMEKAIVCFCERRENKVTSRFMQLVRALTGRKVLLENSKNLTSTCISAANSIHRVLDRHQCVQSAFTRLSAKAQSVNAQSGK